MVWPNKLWGGIASNIVENAELNGYGRSSRTRPSRRQTASHGAGRYDMSGPPPPYNHGPPPSAPSGGGPYMGSDGRMHYPAQHGGGPPPTPPGYRRGGGGGFVNTGGLGESRGYAPADQPPPYTSPHMPMSGSRGRPPSPDYGGYGGGSPGGHPPSHGFDYGGGGGRHTGGPPSRPSFSRPHGPPPSGSRGPSGPYGSFENPYPYGQGPMDLGRGGGPPRSPAYGGGGGGDGASEHGASGYEGSEYGGSGHGEEPIIREVRPRGYGGGGGGGSYGRDRSHTTRGPSTRDYGGYHDYSPETSYRARRASHRPSSPPYSTRSTTGSTSAPRSPLEQLPKRQISRRRSDRPFTPVFSMRNPTAVAPLSPSELPPRRRHYRSPSPPDSPLYETRVPWGSRAASSSVNARYETCVRKGFRSPSPAVSARFETRKPSCRSPAPPYPRSPSSLSDAHTPKEPRYPSPSPSLRARFEAWKKAHPDLSSPEPLSPEYETVEPKGYRSPPPQSDHSSRSPSPASGSSAHTDTSPLPTPPPISSLPASAIRDLLVGRTYCYWPDFRLADIFKRKYPAHKALHDHATLVAVYLQLERDKGGEWAKWAGEGAVEERKRVHEELHADGERWGDRQVALDGMGWACRRCAEDGGTYRKVLSEGEGRARKEWNRRRGG